MRELAAILLAVAVLLPAARMQGVRGGKLRRLENLTAAGTQQSPVNNGSAWASAKRLLPGGVLRRLRILGFVPGGGTIGLALIIVGLPAAMAAIFAGPLAALALTSTIVLAAFLVLNLLAARRIAELGALLPGFLDRIRQLLIIGNSLPTAFARAVHGSQPRLGVFFAPALRRISNGESCSESIRQCAEDIDLYEMRLFAASVATNMRFGGSLTHSLGNLVSYLRKRASIERELRASTAQIRTSAWVLGLLPMLVAGLIVVQNRDYASWFVTHTAGRHMLWYCVASQIVGACLMRAVVRTSF